MQATGKYSSKEAIRGALARNKRLGINHRPKDRSDKYALKSQFKDMLASYVFDSLGVSPKQFLDTQQSQYSAEQNFRDRRQNNIDLARGRQLSGVMFDDDLGHNVPMYEYLRRRGIDFLTYNIISKLVRSLVGQYREISAENIVKCDTKDDKANEIANVLTECVSRVKKKNKGRNKDAMNYKEMLLSGRPVFKTMWGSKHNMSKVDVVYRIVGSDKFTVNSGITDYDLDNLHTATEIHDTSLDEIVTNFANGNYDRGQEIRKGYINHQGDNRIQSQYSSQSYDGMQRRNQSFYAQGANVGSYRYYEIWTLISNFEAIVTDPLDQNRRTVHKYRNPEEVRKEVEAENAMRDELMQGESTNQAYKQVFETDYTSRMYAMFITPWGELLDITESPFANGGHPYSFSPPDINGEIWGIVEEVENPQKSMNRQIMQADAIVQNSIKGAIFIPDTAIPDEMSNKEYLKRVKGVDGAFVYKADLTNPDLKPFQMYANSSNVSSNVQQLIGLYSGLVDDISGNYGAAQGQSSSSKTASGYAQETQNAGLNIRDIIDNYIGVTVERDEKILDLIKQGYTKEDYYAVTGKEIDPIEVRKFDYYVEQSKGINSPAHRLALEQELLQLVYNQLMPFEVFLDVSTNPVMIQAKQKMQELQKRQMETGQMPVNGQVPQQMMAGQEMNPNQELQTQSQDQAPL